MAAACLVVPSGAAAGFDPGADGIVSTRELPDPPELLSRAEAAAYWTPERMAAAQPLDLLIDDTGTPVPAPEPRAGGIAEKVPGKKLKKKPNRMFGKVFLSFGATNFVCSGTALKSPTKNLALTAGHCVHDGTGFASNLTFVPAYNGNKATGADQAPFGQYPAAAVSVRVEWASGRDFSVDFAIIETVPRVPFPAQAPTPAAEVQDEVGAHRMGFEQPARQTYEPYGYPVQPAELFDGKRLYRCKSGLEGRDQTITGAGPPPLRVKCNMANGSSGGGWLTNVNTNKVGTILSNVSYGRQSDPGFFYGPKYGARARSLYEFAVACALDPTSEGC